MPPEVSSGNETITYTQLPFRTRGLFPHLPPVEIPFEEVPNDDLARNAVKCFTALRVTIPNIHTDPGDADSTTDAKASSSPRIGLHSPRANGIREITRQTTLRHREEEIAAKAGAIAAAELDGGDIMSVISEDFPYPYPATQNAAIIWAEMLARMEADINTLSTSGELSDHPDDMLTEFFKAGCSHSLDIEPMLDFLRSVPLVSSPDRCIGDSFPLFLAQAVTSSEGDAVEAGLKVAATIGLELLVEDLEHAVTIIKLPNPHLLHHLVRRLDASSIPPDEPQRKDYLHKLYAIFKKSLTAGTSEGTLKAHLTLLSRFSELHEQPGLLVEPVNQLITQVPNAFYGIDANTDRLYTLMEFTLAHGTPNQITEAVRSIFSKIDTIADIRSGRGSEREYAMLDNLLSKLTCFVQSRPSDRQLAACGEIAHLIASKRYGRYLTETDTAIENMLPYLAESYEYQLYKRFPILAQRILIQGEEQEVPIEKATELFGPNLGSVMAIAEKDHTFPERLMIHEGPTLDRKAWRFAAVRTWIHSEKIEMPSARKIFSERVDLSDLQVLYSESREVLPGREFFVKDLTERANKALKQYARQVHDGKPKERAITISAMALLEQLAWDGRLENKELMRNLYYYFEAIGEIEQLRLARPVALRALQETLGIEEKETASVREEES